ncbi:MAG TPA: hypothetical protein VGF30_15910 [Bacteroidia bacterium]
MSILKITAICTIVLLSILLVNCGEDKPKEVHEPFRLKTTINVPGMQTHFKGFYVYDRTQKIHITASEKNKKPFDFNLMDKESYKNFSRTDSIGIIYFCKMINRKSVDTTVILNKGEYLFAFDNFRQEDMITLTYQIEKIDPITQ